MGYDPFESPSDVGWEPNPGNAGNIMGGAGPAFPGQTVSDGLWRGGRESIISRQRKGTLCVGYVHSQRNGVRGSTGERGQTLRYLFRGKGDDHFASANGGIVFVGCAHACATEWGKGGGQNEEDVWGHPPIPCGAIVHSEKWKTFYVFVNSE